jgi:hypothetical protein
MAPQPFPDNLFRASGVQLDASHVQPDLVQVLQQLAITRSNFQNIADLVCQ